MFNPWRSYKMWRHGRGFGVLSPLAYHLIKNVVRDRYACYYYEEATTEVIRHLKRHDVRVAYRLVSARSPQSVVLVCDNPGHVTAWLTVISSIVSENCRVTVYSGVELDDADMTIIDADKIPGLPVSRPHSNKGNWTITLGLNRHLRRQSWNAVVQAPGYNAMTIDSRAGVALTVRRHNLPRQTILTRL